MKINARGNEYIDRQHDNTIEGRSCLYGTVGEHCESTWDMFHKGTDMDSTGDGEELQKIDMGVGGQV